MTKALRITEWSSLVEIYWQIFYLKSGVRFFDSIDQNFKLEKIWKGYLAFFRPSLLLVLRHHLGSDQIEFPLFKTVIFESCNRIMDGLAAISIQVTNSWIFTNLTFRGISDSSNDGNFNQKVYGFRIITLMVMEPNFENIFDKKFSKNKELI